MNLPSLQSLGQSVSRVFNRFPLQMLIAIISTGIWWYLIENPNSHAMAVGKSLIVCNFVFTLLLSADLFCEVNRATKLKRWIFRIVSLLIGLAIFFSINPFTNKADFFRVFLIAFSFHLLVSFAPFIGRSSLNGFWQYNRILFLRFLTAAFYAFVLFVGLAMALYAVDGLFNVSIDSKRYTELFALVSAGFSSIFFLAGVPDDFSALENDNSYPKGLKIFTQYVLIPLMTIYLAILLVYEVKIILIWSLPKGIVSSLILGYAVFGVLSLLLIHPIKAMPGNGWMRLFSKFFYLMMIPLVILLILAITKRIGNYGITEPRFVLIVLAIWLTGITIYFLLNKRQNIKVIPISLCLLALGITYGPQSATSISRSSQKVRLAKLMKSKDRKDVKERSSVVRYLVANHGLVSIQQFTSVDLVAVDAKIKSKSMKRDGYEYEIKSRQLDTALVILNVRDIENDGRFKQFFISSENRGLIDIRGYDAVFSLDNFADSTKRFNGAKLIVTQKAGGKGGKYSSKIIVNLGAEKPLEFNLLNLAKETYKDYEEGRLNRGDYNTRLYPDEKMRFSQETKDCVITLVVSSVNGDYNDELNDFSWLSFKTYLLIKQKK